MKLFIQLGNGIECTCAVQGLLACKRYTGFASFSHCYAKNGGELVTVTFCNGTSIYYTDGIVTTTGDKEHIEETLAICCGWDAHKDIVYINDKPAVYINHKPAVYIDDKPADTRWEHNESRIYLALV